LQHVKESLSCRFFFRSLCQYLSLLNFAFEATSGTTISIVSMSIFFLFSKSGARFARGDRGFLLTSSAPRVAATARR
jgi:hypothetical protein